jgi:acyloxyacyl hydrolase
LNQHFRGRSWRGKDCNDSDASVHPGALDAGGAIDQNCNGISGTDPATGTPYETEFCSGDYAPMGLAIVGDSAAAHFHIPPQYLNAPTWNLSGLLEMAANEADWPQCSWATGYRNESTQCPRMGALPAPPASFYQRWVGLNRCNHGDLQNIGVNGARTGSMAPPNGVINALSRNKATDAPLLVIYALIGNDVCSSGHDWTTVAEFQANVLKSLDYLEATLPVGSHVAFLGLADGRVLYDTTHTHIHPVGMPYPAVYEFLSCNNCNPCWGWLNTNETWRNATSAQAADLTAVYDTIIAANATRYKSFDVRVPSPAGAPPPHTRHTPHARSPPPHPRRCTTCAWTGRPSSQTTWRAAAMRL